jgi:hypothetical protein
MPSRLVTEARALRAELAGGERKSRSQPLVTRIQLQEQRLLHLDRQRADIVGKSAGRRDGRCSTAS